jgi:hypothetical protein
MFFRIVFQPVKVLRHLLWQKFPWPKLRCPNRSLWRLPAYLGNNLIQSSPEKPCWQGTGKEEDLMMPGKYMVN